MSIQQRFAACIRKTKELTQEYEDLLREYRRENYVDAPLGRLFPITPCERQDNVMVQLPKDTLCLVDSAGRTIFTRTDDGKWE